MPTTTVTRTWTPWGMNTDGVGVFAKVFAAKWQLATTLGQLVTCLINLSKFIILIMWMHFKSFNCQKWPTIDNLPYCRERYHILASCFGGLSKFLFSSTVSRLFEGAAGERGSSSAVFLICPGVSRWVLRGCSSSVSGFEPPSRALHTCQPASHSRWSPSSSSSAEEEMCANHKVIHWHGGTAFATIECKVLFCAVEEKLISMFQKFAIIERVV